jgi:hypothetical protein
MAEYGLVENNCRSKSKSIDSLELLSVLRERKDEESIVPRSDSVSF